MQLQRFAGITAITLILFGGAGPIEALESLDEEKTILQIGIWNPVQLYSQETAVSGLRLNIPYGVNLDMVGYSLGVINQNLRDSKGIELGLINRSGRDVTGFQIGLVNSAGRELHTAQLGLYNWAEVSGGLQAGLVNRARLSKGLQLGLLNFAYEVTGGAQVGLLNFSKETDWKVLPLIRWVW